MNLPHQSAGQMRFIAITALTEATGINLSQGIVPSFFDCKSSCLMSCKLGIICFPLCEHICNYLTT